MPASRPLMLKGSFAQPRKTLEMWVSVVPPGIGSEFGGFRANYTFVSRNSLNESCGGTSDVWMPCRKCELTCDQLSCPKSAVCSAGCGCPPDRPIRHEGKCVTLEKCPNRAECGKSGLESRTSSSNTVNLLYVWKVYLVAFLNYSRPISYMSAMFQVKKVTAQVGLVG